MPKLNFLTAWNIYIKKTISGLNSGTPLEQSTSSSISDLNQSQKLVLEYSQIKERVNAANTFTQTAINNLQPSSPQGKGLMTISKAAMWLGVSPDTLRNWEKKGLISSQRTPGGSRRYSRKEIERLRYELADKPIYNKKTKSEAPPPNHPPEDLTKSSITDLLTRATEQGSLLQDHKILPTEEPNYASSEQFELNLTDPLAMKLASVFLIAIVFFTLSTATIIFKPQIGSKIANAFYKRQGLEQTNQITKISQNISKDNNVLAAAAARGLLTINSDVNIQGALNSVGAISTPSTINGLKLQPTSTGYSISGSTSSATLAVSGNSVINQNVSTTAAPTFTSLNLSSTSNQLVFQSGGPTGTLTWTPTSAQILTLPNATDTLVARNTTDTLTNKSMSGSANTFTNIPNSALTNNTITISAGSNMSGGGTISLGGSGSISLMSSPSITGTLTVAGATILSSTLDVAGATTLSSTLAVTGAATFSSDVTISGTVTNTGQQVLTYVPTAATVGTGPLYINPASATSNYTLLGIAVGGTEKLRINSNGNIGLGGADVTASNLITAGSTSIFNVDTSGNTTIGGLLSANGNVDLGTGVANTITFMGVVDSNIVPDANNSRDLGSASKNWNNGYFNNVNANNISGTVTGGSTTSATWLINSDNATNNAEISSLAYSVGTAPINAVVQWNAANDAGNKIAGFDNTLLSNYPLAVFSQVSGANQTFTSGNIFSYSQPSTHAITQTGAFIGANLDFSSNMTVPDSSSGNQTGVKVTLKDGGASATSKGFEFSGTGDYGIFNSGETYNYFSGNVGIGISTPINSLTIAKTTTNFTAADFFNSTPSASGITSQTVILRGNFGSSTGSQQVGGNITFGKDNDYFGGGGTRNDSFMALYTALDNVDVERIRITSNGLVGIGTTSPNNRLEVLSTTSPQLRVAYDTSNYSTLGVASTGATTLTTAGTAPTLTLSTGASNGAINISPNGTGAVTFTSGVATGTTTTSANVFTDASLTSGTLNYLTSSSITTGKLLDVTTDGANTWTGNGTTNGLIDFASSSTAGAGSASSILLNLSRSGANTNASHTAYGVYSNVTNTGTTSNNVAGYFSASGATSNYGLIVANGMVGIGTTAPQVLVDIAKTYTNPSATDYNLRSTTKITATSGAIASNIGISAERADLRLDVTNSQNWNQALNNTTTPLAASFASFSVDGGGATGTIANASGFISDLRMGGATVTNFANYVAEVTQASTVGTRYGLYVGNPGTVTTSLTTQYGGYIEPLTSGTNNVGFAIDEATGTKQTNLLIGTSTIPTGSYSIYNSSTDQNYFAGNVGIGTSTPNNKLEILSTTTPQLRVAYDGTTNFTTMAVASNGATTFDANGAGAAFTFSDGVTANTFASSGSTITGGSINSTTIGASSASTGAFTTLTSNNTTTIGNGSGIVTSIGNSGGAAAINLTSGTGSQTFTSSVATGTTTTSGFVFTDSALTSGTLNYLTSSSITTGKLLEVTTDGANTWTGNGTTNGLIDLSSSSTAGTASSSDIMLKVARSGANAQLAHTAYGLYSTVTNTNVTSGTNVAAYLSASGATTANYGLLVENGFVGIGTTAPTTKFHVQTTDASFRSSLFEHIETAVNQPIIVLKKGRGTPSAITTVAISDFLGSVTFAGYYDSTHAITGASISGVVDAAPSSNMPTALTFSTGVSGGGTEYMRISSGGLVGIGTTSSNNKLEILSTTSPQLRVAYDGTTNYTTMAVASNGATTFDANGAGAAFTFSDPVSFSSSTATITGGTINSTTIGAVNPSSGAFTTLTSNNTTNIGNGSGIVTSIGNSGGAAAINLTSGTGSQTFASSVVSGTTTTSAFVFSDAALTSGTGSYLTSSSITTGKLLDVTTEAGNTWTGNGTTNGLIDFRSTSTAAAGTASNILLNLTRSGANTNSAVTSYGQYTAVSNTGTTSVNVGGYFSATGAITNRGLEVAAMTGATSTGLTIGALSGTTADTGINIGAISGSGATGTGITIGEISTTGATNKGLDIGNISGATSNNYGINIGTLTGGTGSSVYGINSGTLTSVASGTNYQTNLGAVVGATSATFGSINTGAVSGAGTTSYGINLGTNSATATTNYGAKIGAVSGAGTTNYGLYVDTVSGAGANYAAVFAGGNVGIGTTSPTQQLHITGNFLADNASSRITVGASGYLSRIGIYSTPTFTDSATSIYGMTSTATVSNSNTAYTGLNESLSVSVGATITDVYGLMIGDPSGAGAVTNNYGIYVNPPTKGGTKNVAAYFGGKVGIGTTSPSNQLEVLSTTTPQLRVAYDAATNFTTMAVASNGATTFDANGAGAAFTFSDGVTANTFASSGATLTGGTINNMAIGGSTAAAGAFTTLTSNNTTNIGNGSGIVTSIGNSGGAAAINLTSGTGSQTFASSVVSGTTTTSAFVFSDAALTSGTLNYLTSSSITTGKLLEVTTDGTNTWTGNGTTNGLIDLSSSSTAAAGTASNILLNLTRSGANTNSAVTSYGQYTAVSNTGTTSVNVGGYFSALGAITNRGLEVAAMTGATSTGLTIGALSGTTADVGINVGAISGTGATGGGITVGNISTTGATNYGLQLGTMTGGTTSNYQITTGILTSATTTTNAQLNLGGVVTTGGTTNYGITVGALSGTGTTNNGINISTLTSTGTTSTALNIGGLTGAATTNNGIAIGAISGNTTTSNGISLSTLTGGASTTTLNQISTGTLTASATSSTDYQANLGAVVGTTSSTFGSINTGAISGAGTQSAGIVLGANSSTATTNYGITVGAISGAGTTNTGVNVGAVSGATNNYAIKTAGGSVDLTDASNTVASLSLTNNTATTIGNGGNTLGVIDLQSTSLTTGNFMNIETNALTTGKAVNISTTTTQTTGTLLSLASTSTALAGTTVTGNGLLENLDWTPGSATTATGDLWRLHIGPNGVTTGSVFNIVNDTSSIFSISQTAVTTSLPANFTAAGDVAIAYDINFTNPTASYIKSSAPLYIQAGPVYGNNDLTLQTFGTGAVNILQSIASNGSPTAFNIIGAAHTTLTASAEASDVNFNLARTVQFSTGALTTQRAIQINAPTYGFVGASTITNASTLAISGAPVSGTNTTITDAAALRISGGSVSGGTAVTRGWGLYVDAPTNCTSGTCYGATFATGNVGIGTTGPTTVLSALGTISSATTNAIATITNNNSTDSANTIGLRVNLGIGTTTTNGRYATFYANVTSGDTGGSREGSIQAISGGVSYNTGAGDFAEKFYVPESTEPGDVIGFTNGNNTKATNGNKILGVVSDTAGFVGNNHETEDPASNPVVGLLGQIKTKVSSENGDIQKGDYITASSIPGIAMKATKPGQVLGKAMESYSSSNPNNIGKILVYVNVSYADPNNFLASLSLDNDGNLIAPKFTADHMVITDNITVTNPDQNSVLAYDTIQNGNTTKYGINVGSSLRNIEAKVVESSQNIAAANAAIAAVQTDVASQSAKLAQTQNTTLSLVDQIASAAATLASSKDSIASLQNDVSNLKLTPPDVLLATGSATLADLTVTSQATFSAQLTAYNTTVQNDFKSLGNSILGNTAVNGNFSVDGVFTIDNGSEINVIGMPGVVNSGILYLQKSALATGVDIFDGKVLIDNTGKITAQAVLSAEYQVVAGKTSGTGTITSGTSYIDIQNTTVTAGSRILITPTTGTNMVLAVTSKTAGSKFRVSIPSNAATNISFDWWLLNEVSN